jgi:gliding motility-associated-like protein
MNLFKQIALSIFAITISLISYGQACTTLGQTPSTAFPVCGTSVFTQANVPVCSTNAIYVPGCTGDGASYENKNPFFYRFTCFAAGTLGFTIAPLAANEDYDWQLYDITGHNPDDIFTDRTLVVTGNWAGTFGPTGTSASGATGGIQCASDPSSGAPTFAAMPTLIIGHEYLLMISHYTDTQSGYNLSFTGGTAVITDPLEPHILKASASCDGLEIKVKLNKKVRCNSYTSTGSEFSLMPAVATVVSATPDSCSLAFDFDELTLRLSTPLTNNNYQLVINNGTDNNTLLDVCGRNIPQNEQVPFTYYIPQPIFADSIGKPGCAPDSIKLYFPKRIICSTIDPAGTDFLVTGPSPVNVVSASGDCSTGKTDFVVVKFNRPIVIGGTYRLTLKAGLDGTTLMDECGVVIPIQSLNFNVVDTVNADFSNTATLGCLENNYLFSHNGAHGVNSWNWNFNNTVTATTQSYHIAFPSLSNNTITLIVSNGICSDTSTRNLILNNKVKASFTIPDSLICPEDTLKIKNTSTGLIDIWKWNFGALSTSNVKDPAPFLFPFVNREMVYTIKLLATNIQMGCTDSMEKLVRVLDFCLIEVPTGFTPNGDGLNDYFQPHNALKADNYQFKVYNRWGQLVFQTRNWQDKWDGRVNGAMQTTGVYVWMLSYTNRDTGRPIFRKGTVTLIR